MARTCTSLDNVQLAVCEVVANASSLLRFLVS
jgi:hypothetical protein